jgi:hypothetical protein
MKWAFALAFMLALGRVVAAQTGVGDACLADATVQMPAGGVMTVDVAPVVVLTGNSKRCGARIKNAGTAAMSCGPATVAVSATVGWPLAAGETLQLGQEGREQWQCIKTTATSTTAAILEAVSR